MFDVKPVDETGNLDWGRMDPTRGRVQCIGDDPYVRKQCVGDDPYVRPGSFSESRRNVKAYFLGVGVESDKAPVFHDPDFDLDALIAENEEKLERMMREESLRMEKALKLQQQRAYLEQLKQERLDQQLKRQIQRQHELEAQQAMLRELEHKRILAQQQLQTERQQKEALLAEERLRRDEERRRILEDEELRRQQQLSQLQQAKLEQQKREELLREERQRRQEERVRIIESHVEQMKQQQKLLQEKAWHEQQERNAAIKAQREREEAEHAKWLKQQLAEEAQRREEAAKMAEKRLAARKKIQKQQEKKNRTFFAGILSSKKNERKRSFQRRRNVQGGFSWGDLFRRNEFAFAFDARKTGLSFVVMAMVLSLFIGSVSFASKGLGLKGKVLGVSQAGFANLSSAVGDLSKQNFEGSSQQFSDAFANFSQASQDFEEVGGSLLDATRFIPYASILSSGKNSVEAGKHLSAAGQALNEVVKEVSGLKNPIDPANSNVSLLDIFQSAQKNIAIAKTELDSAQQNIDKINIDDLPRDKQDKFLLLKQQLPAIRSGMDAVLNNSQIFTELLGGNGPRKYLFLFQNNSEMRATGGFIGSYGLMDVSNGHVRKFFIDGIFNPDGQLREKIVPPQPIQKISAAWSLHDSNWFPDFPTSAQKAVEFYEKTGGPTADGVIAITPTLMQKLLQITGPIEMPEYDVTLDADNFLDLTQYQVEEGYDKTENQPKKILSDLAPLVLDKLLSSRDIDTISKTAQAFLDGLKEKHVLLYSQDKRIESIISQQGWSGEILPSQKDYISVINTNINGYKTDAIVDEKIDHKAEIQNDGSITDTVTITRHHNGGDSQYEWLNKVNADYMRVYVPQGSKLLEVSGQTREEDKSPLDYDALNFQRDPDVQQQESGIVIDPSSGTRIYDEDGKTVFANWTYVSPQETMTITYKYELPFRLFQITSGSGQQVDSYSLVAEKQSGSVGSDFSSKISYPSDYSAKWTFPENVQNSSNEILENTKLDIDRFAGVVFERK